MRGAALTCAEVHQKVLENFINAKQDVVIPVPQDAIALLAQPGRSVAVVTRLINVLAPVQLDRHLLIDASEVDDEAPDRVLPSELAAVQPPIAQIPQ